MEEAPARIEVPLAFEDVDIDVLVQLIADMLDRLISHNDQIPLSPEGLTRFHSRTAPGISVLEYLRRIVKFTRVERVCLLITLHYIDQICTRMPTFTLSSLTCHRFLITAVTVSSKALCDVFSSNSIYARVGGIPVAELNMLEREFLRMIDWQLTAPGLKPSFVVHDHSPGASQCTREILQEYYVNLVRTHSVGRYAITALESSSSISSDDDMDWETGRSRSPSPPQAGSSNRNREFVPGEASTILIDTATLTRQSPKPPTLEQNMAFAAFQQSYMQQDGGT